MLFDAYGREIKEVPKKPLTEMLGVVRVRDQWSSYPSVKLRPETLAAIFRDADVGHIERQAELFEEMEEKDPVLGGVLQARRLAVQGLDIEVLPADDTPEAEEIAASFRDNLDDIDLDDLYLYLLDAIGKGFGTAEINWDLSEGQAWIHSLEWIPQKRWTYVEMSAAWDAPLPKLPKLLTDGEPVRGIDVPPFKVVYHVYRARSGFAQRGGLLRPVTYYYLFKNYAVKDWVIFLEKFGQPLRLGKFSAGASEDDKRVLKEAVQSLGTDAGAIISDSTMLDILEAKMTTASSDLYERFTQLCDKYYEIAVLGQTATTEGTPGKLGAESARENVRYDLIRADSRALAKTIRWQLAWPWVGFNYGWDKPVPKIRFPVEEPEDLEKLSRVHTNLQTMGMELPKSYVRKKYGIPEPEPGEEILTAPKPPLGNNPFGDNLAALKKKIPIGSRLVDLD